MTFQNRKKFCYFKENGIVDIDYKDTKLLRRFVNDQGKIMPRRVTGTSSKMHRKLVKSIKIFTEFIAFTNITNKQSNSCVFLDR